MTKTVLVPQLTKRTIALAHAHAKGCRKDASECLPCRVNAEYYSRLAPAHLAECLQDTKTQRGTLKLGTVAIENLIDRTTDNVRAGRQTGRAARDVNAAMQWFKWYEENGGRL